jgi:hypothetical protein
LGSTQTLRQTNASSSRRQLQHFDGSWHTTPRRSVHNAKRAGAYDTMQLQLLLLGCCVE